MAQSQRENVARDIAQYLTVSPTIARKLADPFRMLHNALCNCDNDALVKLQGVTLVEAATLYGQATGLRQEFASKD